MTPRTFRQFALFKSPDLFHGSNLRQGKRKIARPIDPKRAIHIVLKSNKARGACSLLQPKRAKRIDDLIEKSAIRYKIKIYRFVNVGNHVHLLIKTSNRIHFQNFLRTITGKIAILVTGAKKGQKKGKFWDGLTFTRVVNWGKDFEAMGRSLLKNQIESFGYGVDIEKALVRQGILILRPAPG